MGKARIVKWFENLGMIETSTAVMEFGIGFRTALAILGFIFLYGLTL